MENKRRKIKTAVFLGFDLVLLLAALISASCLRGLLLSQEAAAVWRGQSEERFAQISCFFPQTAAVSEDTVYYFRQSLDMKLVEASLEAPENGSLWRDAYSASGTLVVSSDKGSSETAAIGVGGDFFMFHPLRLISGSYFDGGGLMSDLVVIDEELAWKLFGSNDVCGMTVTISGEPYIIAGVVSREDDFASKAAYPGGAGIFLSYSALYKNLPDAGITCYEAVLPDPVTGFALDTVSGGFSDAEVLQNTGRFDFANNIELLKQFGKRSMQSGGIIYPYWENAARIVEDYLALLAVITLLLCVNPLIVALYTLRILFKYLKRWARKLRGAAERYGEKRRTRGYEPAGPAPGGEEPVFYCGDDMDFPGVEELDIASIVREVLEESNDERI